MICHVVDFSHELFDTYMYVIHENIIGNQIYRYSLKFENIVFKSRQMNLISLLEGRDLMYICVYVCLICLYVCMHTACLTRCGIENIWRMVLKQVRIQRFVCLS